MFSKIEQILDDVRVGKPVIIVDSPERENEGDIFIAAEKITSNSIGFMRRYATGLICTPIYSTRLDDLGLDLMLPSSYQDKSRCRFTYSLDYKHGVTTGISDGDREITIKALIDNNIGLNDFYIPGHVFPLRAEKGGVLEREGHTEAAVDLARISGLYPAGVICEVIKEDGSMARLGDLIRFARKHEIKICTIEQIKSFYK